MQSKQEDFFSLTQLIKYLRELSNKEESIKSK